MAKTPNSSQDQMPQGSGNPNATGAVAPSGCYNVYTAGRFDGYVAGEGQITTTDNDGYPYPGSKVLGKVQL